MELIKKDVYVAHDGREFDNGQDCLRWERYLLMPEPVHLRDEQIVGLLRNAFPIPFYHWAKDNFARITLAVRQHGESSGFDFWFHYKVSGEQLNFTGQVYGETSFIISQSAEGPHGDQRSKDWEYFHSISLQAAYEYLNSIGYFTPQQEVLPENPHLKQREWTVIYQHDYSFTPAVVVD